MKKKYILVAIVLLLIIIKFCFFGFISNDYKTCLLKWFRIIADNGGIFSLKETFTDYNYPYLIILSILSYIPIKPLYLIKTISLIFDILIALLGYKFVYKYSHNNEKNSITCFMILLISPIIFLNSCLWGQCDSIYSFFVILSIYYLCEKKTNEAFISFGIAFSLKLQAIFILPLLIIMFFCDNKIKIYHFLIIPLINFIMCIPAYIVGGSILHTFIIYSFQTVEYFDLKLNITNLYSFLPNTSTFKVIGIIVTLVIFLLLLIFYYKRKNSINEYSIINLSLLSLFICYLFLPCMHERYSYLIDVFLIIWSFIYGKKYYIPIITNVCSLVLYINYLFHLGISKPVFQLLTILYFIAFYSFLKTIYDCKIDKPYVKKRHRT